VKCEGENEANENEIKPKNTKQNKTKQVIIRGFYVDSSKVVTCIASIIIGDIRFRVLTLLKTFPLPLMKPSLKNSYYNVILKKAIHQRNEMQNQSTHRSYFRR
jgi:hypothetical protein